MIRMLVVLTAGLGVLLAYATPSEACGIKLSVQSPNVQNQTARSANPSRILLIGSPPRRLARNLNNAGHTVDVASDVDSARSGAYRVIVADQEHVVAARQQYPNAQVVPLTGSTSRNVAAVEESLQRDPTDASGRRVARRAGRQDREPIAVGREQPDRSDQQRAGDPLQAGRGEPDGADPQREPERAQPDQERAQEQERERQQQARAEQQDRERQQQARAEQQDRERRQQDRERQQVAQRDRATRDHRAVAQDVTAEFHEEVFFATNASRLGSEGQQAMRATAAWLAENPGVTIVIEGHTNTPGDPRYNMRLSQRRAEAARDFLVRQGVDSSRIEVEWFGEERPAYGDGIDGRNRRVVIRR